MNNSEENNFSSVRAEILTQLLENRSEFFKFFVHHNSIFKMISDDDYNRLINESQFFSITNTYVSLLTIGSVFVVDQLLMRYLAPNFRIKKFRFPLFLGKYIGIPLFVSTLSYSYLIKQLEQSFFDIDEKYNFGMPEFNVAMDVLERAFNVGKLEELLEERENFDWKKVIEMEEFKQNKSEGNKYLNNL